MIDFISKHTLLFVGIILIVVLLLLFLLIKTSKSKAVVSHVVEKKETKKEEKTEEVEKTTKPDEEAEKTADSDENVEQTDKKTDKSSKKREKIDKSKKSVEQVFKREEKQKPEPIEAKTEGTEEGKDKPQSSITEEDLLSKMEFVKTSKKVSKLSKLEPKVQEEIQEQQVLEEVPAQSDVLEKQDEPLKPKHFDRSKRLTKLVEGDDLDNLFDSHISDKYINVDISKHLDSAENITNKLYDRASKTLANSDKRLIGDEDEDDIKRKSDKQFEEAFIEAKRREIFAKLIAGDEDEEVSEDMRLGEIDIDETTKLDTRTLLVADALARRKSRKKETKK